VTRTEQKRQYQRTTREKRESVGKDGGWHKKKRRKQVNWGGSGEKARRRQKRGNDPGQELPQNAAKKRWAITEWAVVVQKGLR